MLNENVPIREKWSGRPGGEGGVIDQPLVHEVSACERFAQTKNLLLSTMIVCTEIPVAEGSYGICLERFPATARRSTLGYGSCVLVLPQKWTDQCCLRSWTLEKRGIWMFHLSASRSGKRGRRLCQHMRVRVVSASRNESWWVMSWIEDRW